MTQLLSSKPRLRYPGVPALLLFSSLVGILAYSRNYPLHAGAGFAKVATDLLIWLACFWPWAFLGPLVFKLESRFPWGPIGPFRETRWLRNGGILLAAGLAFSYVAYLGTAFLCSLYAYLFSFPMGDLRGIWIPPAPELYLQLFLYLVTAAAAAVIRNWIRLESQDREQAQLQFEKSRLEASLRDAELNVLRMRLNPHFLFNTLQNISVLAQDEPKVASQMLTRLGDLLRAALRSETEPEVPLSAEIALTESYLAVEKMRFGERLRVSMQLAPETAGAMVPTLLLQPLVENAIRHGLNGFARPGLIIIRSELSARQLVLTVTDNGQGVTAASLDDLVLGVGLASTRERLSRMYKENAALALRGLPQGGTEVRVTLPFRSAPSVAQETGSYEPTQNPQTFSSRLSELTQNTQDTENMTSRPSESPQNAQNLSSRPSGRGLPRPEAEGSAFQLRNPR